MIKNKTQRQTITKQAEINIISLKKTGKVI